MSKFWIKLWVDFLDDDKLGCLPEYIQLRFLKLCLLAGDYDKSGQLPSVERIAWRLRLGDDATKVRETLVALRGVGVVEETPTCWVIVNFAKRQAPLTSTERSREYRRKHECNDNTTLSLHTASVYDSASLSVSDSSLLNSREESVNTIPEVQLWFEELTGFPVQPTPENLSAFEKMDRLKATRADLEGAVAFFASVNKVARSPAQLLESVKYQVARRTQTKAKSDGRSGHETSEQRREHFRAMNEALEKNELF